MSSNLVFAITMWNIRGVRARFRIVRIGRILSSPAVLGPGRTLNPSGLFPTHHYEI